MQEYRAREEGLDLVFYGDSITESLRGTQMGTRIEKFYGIPEVADKHYGPIRWAAFSIAGVFETTSFPATLLPLQRRQKHDAFAPVEACLMVMCCRAACMGGGSCVSPEMMLGPEWIAILAQVTRP